MIEFHRSSGPQGTDRSKPDSLEGSCILVCLDRSALGETVLSYAVTLARATNGSLTLVNVVESPDNIASEGHDALVWELRRSEARQYMKQLVERIGRFGINVDLRIEEGRPAERLLATARQQNIEFVVLASHGSHGLGEWNLSSTTAKVVSRTHSSFFVVPATPGYQDTETRIRRILVPLDGSMRASSALPLAERIAKQCDAEILLIHAIETTDLTSFSGISSSDRSLVNCAAKVVASAARNHFSQVAARIRADSIDASVIAMPASSPLDLIYDTIVNEDIDLIVVAAHGLSGNKQFPLGRTSEHLVSHAPVPLLVVQDLNRDQMSRCMRRRRFDTAPLKLGESTVNDTL